jgi:pseudouridine synthase
VSRERLQKILSRAGVASRRRAEELIRAGRVTVNGNVADVGDKADPDHDAIKVDSRLVRLSSSHLYILLNKPPGLITSRSDPEGRPTVYDLLPPGLRSRLAPVGRLDFETEGLLLLTDDGDLANRIAHPRFGCSKTYEVKVKGRPSGSEISRLRDGIVLRGRRTLPARIRPLTRKLGTRTSESNSWWQVEIGEGRTRQIREMFSRIGHPVQRLRRVAIGALRAPRLPKGAYRELTSGELEKLRESTRERS